MPVIYKISAPELVQFLGFAGDPGEAEKFEGFEAAPGAPLPGRLLEFLKTAAGNPLLHGIDLWTEPRWYGTLYGEMDGQIDSDLDDWIECPPEDGREISLYEFSQLPHTQWPKLLPDRLLIGRDDCGVITYGIRTDALAADEPTVEWNRETDPLSAWQADWPLSEFLLASVCDALLGRPSDIAEDLLADAGWHFTWHPNGTKALDAFGIDPAQLHHFHSLYPRSDEQETSLACCIADGELCLIETVGKSRAMLVLSRERPVPPQTA